MSDYLKTFKALADQTISGISVLQTEHHIDCYKVCEYLDIDTTHGYSRSWVLDKLQANISELISPKTGEATLSKKTWSDIHSALIYESVLKDTDNSAYLTLVNVISGQQHEIKAFQYTENWKQAITYAKDYELFNPNTYTVHQASLRNKYPRSTDVATAAKELIKLGCTIELDDIILKITAGLEAVVKSIEDNIIKTGSFNFLTAIFHHLKTNGKYFTVFNRYLITNEITMFPQQTEIMIPYGFLINLAVKHPFAAPQQMSREEAQALLNDITYKAKLLGTVIDLRYYGIFERHFQTVESLPEFVTNLALFDATFAFPSYDLKEIIEYLESLFLWVDAAKFQTDFEFSIDEFTTITKIIDELAPETGPYLFQASAIQQKTTSISAAKIQAILQHLTHAPQQANKDYLFFTDYDKLDFGFKPLLNDNQGFYLLCDKSWCASAFYEALAALVRDPDPKRDQSNNKIGYALEKYIYDQLDKKGISYQHGNYADGTQPNGEADALIQATKSITLIENKKKVLTRRSKTGSDIKLIIDLAGSLLDAHVQTGRTELLLRKQGYIDLTANGQTQTIPYNNREIERIALTHWDFGSFQDREVINNILSIFTKANIGLIREEEPRDAEDFEKLKKKQALWTAQAAELQKIDSRFDHFPFFNCWFLSLSQLRAILNYSHDNESFYKVFRSTRHVTFGTSNFYKEFYYGYIIRQQTP